MQLLAVPNWSFTRVRALDQRVREVLERAPVTVHYAQGDIDHGRTVTAFSGEARAVLDLTLEIAATVLPSIDLSRHTGVHPRIGAMDVAPFLRLDPGPPPLLEVEEFAVTFAERFEIPVFLYERSERGRHEADLPTLRQGGFGRLLERDLKPDYGPIRAHLRWGASVVGVRDWLLAVNVNLASADLVAARELARRVRHLRQEGDERFLGVRSLGFGLGSREQSQLSLNFTLPDITPVDPVVEWAMDQVTALGTRVVGTELIGVIRARDVPTATRLPIRPEQIVPETIE